jgi:hypothetical protein
VLKSKFPDDIPKYRRLMSWVFHRALEELPPDQIIHDYPEPYQDFPKVTKFSKSDQLKKVTRSQKSDQPQKVTKSDQVQKVTKSDQPFKIQEMSLLDLENTEQRLKHLKENGAQERKASLRSSPSKSMFYEEDDSSTITKQCSLAFQKKVQKAYLEGLDKSTPTQDKKIIQKLFHVEQ